MSASFSTTRIGERICTAVRKSNGGGGLVVSTSSSTSTSSTSTTSASTSTSTSSSTSISTSTLSSTTTSPTSTTLSTSSIPATTLGTIPTFVNAPSSTTTSAVQETLPSTTSSTFSQSATITTSTSSAPETSALSLGSTSPESQGLDSSSSSSIIESAITSSSSTAAEEKVSESVTNDNLATTFASSATSIFSSSTPGTVSTATGTTTSAVAGQSEPFNSEAGSTIGAENGSKGGAISTQTTVAVAGGVIGGLALISIIAFLLWFWRKRLMKKRRSTLLTPLNTDGAYRGGEKGPYVISRNSLGPTTIPEKMKAAVGYNYSKLRGRVNGLVNRSPKPSVDLNRGNSQFGPPETLATRSASRPAATSNDTTTKGRFVDWWGRLTEDGNLNWKLRNDPQNERPRNGTYTSISNTTQPGRRGSQPNFLTLLSIEEDQQQRGLSSNPRRSQSLGNENFLGGLGLNFDTENPFSDSNVMSHDSAKVMPLTVPAGGINNPFSDANAIPPPAKSANSGSSSMAGGPTTYVQNIRRSRGHSTSAANLQPPGGAAASRMPSLYRESSLSVETTDTRRNKFRSDPFDLDRPELLVQSSGPGPRGARDSGRDSRFSRPGNNRGLPDMPRPTHTRTESFTSKYSSGVSSLGEWSDPGPDVGPAAGRWVPSPDSMLGRQPSTSRERDPGVGNQRSVGKAL